nr:FabA/FabZ family ACP-dehydratase [uncultured Allomuricauda sp.]
MAHEIIEKLPYSHPFLFVDDLQDINQNGVIGSFTFKNELDFFRGHFKEAPVTPGVILTECCAQIGLVCLGIYLLDAQVKDFEKPQLALSSSEMEFYLPVFPDETVRVESEKIYFRFNKLKCKVKLFNQSGKLACKGILAGMLTGVESGK